MDRFEFYLCFGLFRLAVIVQQIYYRFYHGQTKDERFKALIVVAHILEEQAMRTIEGSSL
jgi:aminoglycoside phosphotransferase (APT) family kinase protein